MRISTAARMLDKKRPGWYKKISIIRLDMTRCMDCVLGQLDGHYRHSRLATKNGEFMANINGLEIWRYEEPAFGGDADINKWIEEIRKRRNGNGPNKRRKARA